MPDFLGEILALEIRNLEQERQLSAMKDKGLLYEGFLTSAHQFPNRPALEVENRVITYAELRQFAFRLAATLQKYDDSDQPSLTAVFASRSATAYAGVLAALLRGHGYVPLNRTFPLERTKLMLERSGCRTVIVDELSASQLPKVLQGVSTKLVIVMPDQLNTREFAAHWHPHQVLGGSDLDNSGDFAPKASSPDNIAYLLFTSGSTGTPKGVMVAHRNVRSYLENVIPRYRICETDRCSQIFDLTFDLSVHDMFVTWECGACLCCPSQKALIKPGGFIVESNLSTWFSVPSTAVFMKKLGVLKPNMYPNLRLSLFCGEALPIDVAKAWSEAAPNSIIENIYGPTELTIACTAYRWDRDQSAAECELGLVPIGEPFAQMDVLVVNQDLEEVPVGTPGELLMSGPQVTLGYWRDPEKTAGSFIVPPGRSKTSYRTGDLVRRPAHGKPLVYLGRVDNQIKILGHRVELSEVEAVVREESGVDAVMAVGWPKTSSGAGGIEIFLQTEDPAPRDLKDRVAKRLPIYMVPRRYHCLSRFPLNANGKYDRENLTQYLETLP